MSLLVFLLTGLSTSSFFLNEYLAKKITKNEHSATQLNFALEQENLTALSFAWKKTSIHSEQWLKLAKTLAKTQGEAAYQLALYYQNNYQDRQEKATFWFKAAIRLNFHKASIALAQFYFQQENFAKASQVLAALPVDIVEGLNIKSQALKAEISINQGQIEQVSL